MKDLTFNSAQSIRSLVRLKSASHQAPNFLDCTQFQKGSYGQAVQKTAINIFTGGDNSNKCCLSTTGS